MTLSLPEYRTVFDNMVYTRDDNNILIVGEKTSGLTHIVMPSRYTVASEEKVINLLAATAGEVEGAASLIVLNPVQTVERKSPLETLIIKLPQEVRMHLRTKNEDLVKFLRQNTPALPMPNVGELPTYVSASYGIVSTEFIARNQANIDGVGWYSTILVHPQIQEAGHGEQWKLNLQLKDGQLHSKQDIDVLIRNGSSVADTFNVSRRRYDKQKVQEVVDALYNGLSSSNAVADLPDKSSEVLTEAALPALIALHENVRAMQSQQVGGRNGSNGSNGRLR